MELLEFVFFCFVVRHRIKQPLTTHIMSTPAQSPNTAADKHQASRHDHENHQSSDTLSKIKRFGISLNNRHSAAAGVVFLLGMGYYFLSRPQNKIATLAKKLQGRDTSEAAAMMKVRCKDGDKSLVKDVVKKVTAADSSKPLNLKPLPVGLVSLGDKGVGLLCFALDSTLFLAIIDPHIGAKPPPGITQEGKLNLLAGPNDDTEVAFSVYAIPYTDSPANRDHVVTIAVTFALSALRQHTVEDATPLTAHQLLESHLFPRDHCIPMGGKQICIVASQDDFGYLTKRFVDYRGEGHTLSSADLFDFKFYDIWDERTDITMLIGGESGSGKTWTMITNMFSRTDLTVYIRLLSSLTADELNSLNDTKVRNGLFCSYAVRAVKEAINSVCAALGRKLMEYDEPEPFYVRICFDEIGGSPTLTRACCAAASAKNLHEALKWSPRVEVRLFAGGTGIGTVNNPGGSENSCFNLIILGASRGCDLYWMYRCKTLASQVDKLFVNDKQSSFLSADAATVNDELERKKKEFRAKLAALTVSVTAVQDNWAAGPNERAKALSARDTTLWSAFEFAYKLGLQDHKLGELCRHALVPEAIFAAVESDSACVLALSNPRLAALILSRCTVVTTQALRSRISARTMAPNIRHDVLQPVANRFRELNGLEDVTAAMACDLVVESFRYVIFDGYRSVAKEYAASELMARRGVLVDNANFVPVKEFNRKLHVEVTLINDTSPAMPTESGKNARTDARTSPAVPTESSKNARTDARTSPAVPTEGHTHIARYLKTVGRFSISPAMVVVLSNLMSNAFEENFSNIGDVFERAVAKFLYFATLVFHGRPVFELVKFIVAPLAIIGGDALAALRSAGSVTFDTLELRVCGSLRTQLWRSNTSGREVRAWIEISPLSLPSADVVLHIPGVITLPFQCKDIVIPRDLDAIIAKSLSTMNDQTDKFAQTLRGLRAPVVPIFFMTRAWNMTNDEIKATSDAVGRNGILAMGIGEPVLKIPWNYTQIRDHQRASWLHQTRRSMMLFDFRKEEPDTTEVVAGPHKAIKYIGSSDARAPSIDNQWIATF